MKRIAVVTYEGRPHLTKSDACIVPLLEQKNVEVVGIPWTKSVDWRDFSLVLIRSPWDYHLHYQKFLSWINTLKQNRVNVWNPPDTIRWNSDKSYMTTRIDPATPTTPTIFVAKKEDIPEASPWKDVVVKPSVGASSYKTKRYTGTDIKGWQKHLSLLVKDRGALFQQYLPEIQHGEYSLMFFDKEFSHAIIKKPQAGEFRIQPEFGGTVSPVVPAQSVIQSARQILLSLTDPLLYARVDGLIVNNAFMLMEIELCEPELFLDTDKHAPEQFVNVILKYLK
ncbi:hypothetical protein HZB58_01155 [Candidatus Gottesmanbacteria bacterium]|nr:hypothetical protein [Candidatus Gottesmanbacteria bacterium]